MLHNSCISAVVISLRWASRGLWASCWKFHVTWNTHTCIILFGLIALHGHSSRRFFHKKIVDIFLISPQKLILQSRDGASKEYPKLMFSWRNKRNIVYKRNISWNQSYLELWWLNLFVFFCFPDATNRDTWRKGKTCKTGTSWVACWFSPWEAPAPWETPASISP